MIDEEQEEENWPIIRLERLDPEQWWTNNLRDALDLETGAWLGRNVIIVGPEDAYPSSLGRTLALAARSLGHMIATGDAFASLREAVECGSERLTAPDVLALDEMTDLPGRLFECLLDVLTIRAGRSTILVGQSEPTIRGFFAEDRRIREGLETFLTGDRCILVRSRVGPAGQGEPAIRDRDRF